MTTNTVAANTTASKNFAGRESRLLQLQAMTIQEKRENKAEARCSAKKNAQIEKKKSIK